MPGTGDTRVIVTITREVLTAHAALASAGPSPEQFTCPKEAQFHGKQTHEQSESEAQGTCWVEIT